MAEKYLINLELADYLTNKGGRFLKSLWCRTAWEKVYEKAKRGDDLYDASTVIDGMVALLTDVLMEEISFHSVASAIRVEDEVDAH